MCFLSLSPGIDKGVILIYLLPFSPVPCDIALSTSRQLALVVHAALTCFPDSIVPQYALPSSVNQTASLAGCSLQPQMHQPAVAVRSPTSSMPLADRPANRAAAECRPSPSTDPTNATPGPAPPVRRAADWHECIGRRQEN